MMVPAVTIDGNQPGRIPSRNTFTDPDGNHGDKVEMAREVADEDSAIAFSWRWSHMNRQPDSARDLANAHGRRTSPPPWRLARWRMTGREGALPDIYPVSDADEFQVAMTKDVKDVLYGHLRPDHSSHSPPGSEHQPETMSRA